MRTATKVGTYRLFFKRLESLSHETLRHLLVIVAMASFPVLIEGQTTNVAVGVAWHVQGVWRLEGQDVPIITGDPIPPGSLLLPEVQAGSHSMVILLPDGRRVLNECFTAQQCTRGFRVPALYHVPSPFAISMLARIRAVLLRDRRNLEPASQSNYVLPREEALAVLDSGNRVRVGGLAATLPNGTYTYTLRKIATSNSASVGGSFDKNASEITFVVPSVGLYEVAVRDNLKRSRIDLFLAAAAPADAVKFESLFGRVQQLLDAWNSYGGWPVHDFQRAYLEALMLGIKPPHERREASAAISMRRGNVTAEPEFSPAPGEFGENVNVTLRCPTPDAVIRYTFDGSQPVSNSQIFKAPIVVGGTEMIIKAFASAAGRKDSPVVTGIFRVREDAESGQ
jgi:hypothetical protein